MWHHVTRAAALVLVLASPVAAQTQDDFFNPETLQRVELWMNDRDWDKLKQNFKANDYYPADLVWNGITTRNIGIRSRGFGSRSGTKPGLRVDMDHYATDQKFLGLKSFILDNLVQDPSGIKETVAMRFFARLGIPASRETHTRLYVNGEYAGLYGLVETVDKDMLARVFGAIDGNVQNDGYLFEYKYQLGSPWRFTYLGSSLDAYKPRFEITTNETKSDAHIWGPIEELVRLVNDTPSATFVQTINDRLDLAAFVRYIALQNFVAENDGFLGYDGMNNFYFYRLEDRPTHVFIAWDEDNAFLFPEFGIDTRHDDNVLWKKTMEQSQYKAMYYTVLSEAAASAAEVAAGQSNGWLGQEMERQLTMIADAMKTDTLKPYSNSDHAAAHETMLGFSNARVAYVECQVAKQLGTTKPAGCQ